MSKIIYAKGITKNADMKERTACKITSLICNKNNKMPGDLISIYKFCEHTGLIKEIVRLFLIR